MDVAGTASRVAPSEEEGGAGGTRSDEEESVFSPAPTFVRAVDACNLSL